MDFDDGLKRVDESFQARLDGLIARDTKEFEIVKQRMSFYDRIAILAGGTMTLSFTALSSLHLRTVVYPELLEGSWIAFVIAIILTMLGSRLMLTYEESRTSWMHANMQSFRVDMHKAAVAMLEDAAIPEFSDKAVGDFNTVTEKRNRAMLSGDGAQVFVLIGYLCLLGFFLPNIR